MGAKTWMIVYSAADARDALRARPLLDREAALKLATALQRWLYQSAVAR